MVEMVGRAWQDEIAVDDVAVDDDESVEFGRLKERSGRWSAIDRVDGIGVGLVVQR